MILADTQAIAAATGRSPSAIRMWASRGLITRHGTGPRGRAMYDLEAADEVAARIDRAMLTTWPDLVLHSGDRRTRAPKNAR